jgi:hypothetical protein
MDHFGILDEDIKLKAPNSEAPSLSYFKQED